MRPLELAAPEHIFRGRFVMDPTVRQTEGNSRPAVVEASDLPSIINELREEVEASRRNRGDADQVRARHEQETAQLRSMIEAMRQALEQAKAEAESERQAVRAASEAEIRDLKEAVVAGRDALESF